MSINQLWLFLNALSHSYTRNNQYGYLMHMHTLRHKHFSKRFTHEKYFFVINSSCYFCVIIIILKQKSKYVYFWGAVKGVKP